MCFIFWGTNPVSEWYDESRCWPRFEEVNVLFFFFLLFLYNLLFLESFFSCVFTLSFFLSVFIRYVSLSLSTYQHSLHYYSTSSLLLLPKGPLEPVQTAKRQINHSPSFFLLKEVEKTLFFFFFFSYCMFYDMNRKFSRRRSFSDQSGDIQTQTQNFYLEKYNKNLQL